MLGRIISTNLKLSHLSSLGISILQFILIGAKKAPKQVQSLIEQTHQQVVDPNNQRNVIELIEKIIIYKFTHHGTALRWRQSIMLGVHALKQLYEIDDSQWLGETISLLRNHQFQQLDLEHLIEELEDLGKEKKNAVASLLEQVIRHLLLLQHWTKETEYNTINWQEEIYNFRTQLRRKITANLRNYLEEELNYIYEDALGFVKIKTANTVIFPSQCPYSLEQLLDRDWLP